MKRLVLLLSLLLAIPAFGQTAFNVWTPKGHIVTDPGAGPLGNPSVVQAASGCVIVASPCFKMWAGDDSNRGLYYYESLDGLTLWTAHPSNPILPTATIAFPTLFFVSGTYYLYGGTTAFPNASINTWTSSDGITFASQGTALSEGGVGTWDCCGTYQLNFADIIAGTWYAYYSGFNGTKFGEGLATSSNGITWTKSPSAPQFPGPIGNLSIFHAGSLYYAYAPFPNANAALAAVDNNPIGRWSASSPEGPWTPLMFNGVQVPVYYVATPAELNTGGGGLPGANANDPHIVIDSVHGNMLLYYTYTETGGVESGVYAAEAVGFTPNALVSSLEGVIGVPFTGMPGLNLTTSATDNFTRANANPIGGNWNPRVAGSTAQILSDVVRGSAAGTPGDSYWNGLVWPNDQWSQITINNEAAGSFLGPTVRTSTGGVATSYRLLLQSGTGAGAGLILQKQVAGVSTNEQTLAFTINVGDTLMYAVNGTSVMAFWNGNLVAMFTDAVITSGAAGFEVLGTTSVNNSGISAWSGGNFGNSPALTATSGRKITF